MSKIRNTISSQNSFDTVVHIPDNNKSKTLGVLWDSTSNTLRYLVKYSEILNVVTKRKIISMVAQICDTLGLVGPVIITANVIL